MKYMITTPHTNEECLRALDEQLVMGPDVLNKFYYGCKAGDHTGYALVDASDELEARNLVPNFLISKARIVKVELINPEEIRSAHSKAA